MTTDRPLRVHCDVLTQLYDDPSIDSIVAPQFADALYGVVKDLRPETVLEVGMAHGASTLAILTAMEESGFGRLISIDPYQNSGTWRGTDHVASAHLAHRHQLIEEPDFLALPDLLRSGISLDLAYIDGWHTFDYTLLDFFYVDKMLNESGVVGFNDCHYPAVERVLGFVKSHRKYAPFDVGLPETHTVVRRRRGLPLARWTGRRVNGNDQYFRKSRTWEPDFRYWADF